MSIHDQSILTIERMAAAAADDVMEQLFLVVRQAVTREVAEELADQREQLAEERERLERLAEDVGNPLPMIRDLVTAAGKVSNASAALTRAIFTANEKNARKALDNALTDLRQAYGQYAAFKKLKGN